LLPTASWSEDDDWIPLFQGKKQQKQLISALRRPKATLQVIDLIGVCAKFRYGKEQRNFGSLTEEINGLTAELQRNFISRLPGPFFRRSSAILLAQDPRGGTCRLMWPNG
jgi:hypothetical protein